MSAPDSAASVSAEGDSARVETWLPLSPDELQAFFSDLEFVYRLNPHLDVREWHATPDGFRLVAINELNGRCLDSEVRVERGASTVHAAAAEETGGAALSLTLHWSSGLRRASEFRGMSDGDGVRLTVIDRYPRVEDASDPRLVDVDRTLLPWIAAIRRHVLARRRWAWLPGWRWWHERLMPGMAPRSRRIVRLLVWISLLELLVFLVAVLILRLLN